MALRADLLTRVRNIHWASGAFIIVMQDKVYYYVPPSTVRVLQFPASALFPSFLSSSAARIEGNPSRKVFLVNASVEVEETREQAAVVFTSNNGIDWRETFRAPTGTNVATIPTALVRNPDGNFYLDLRRSSIESLTSINREQVFQSAGGETWSGPISSTNIPFGAEDAGYRSSFPSTHCAHNNCKDTLDQNVPDGFMRNDTGVNVLMRPKTPVTIKYGVPSYDYGSSNEVEKITSAGIVSLPIPVLATVDCVAGSGATWVAGGRSGAAVSFNTGATWSKVAIGGDDVILSISSTSV